MAGRPRRALACRRKCVASGTVLGVAQRRHDDREHAQAEVEVVAKAARPHLGGEVPIGRGDDPDVDPPGSLLADPRELAVLEHAQQLALERERDLADLVEEERTAVGSLETADAVLLRAGEGAPHVPEELALEEVLRDRRAVDADERPLGAPAVRVDAPGDELLPRPGLAEDEHRGVGRRDQIGLTQRLLERGAPATIAPPARAMRASSRR
jgi:hypothetical protein